MLPVVNRAADVAPVAPACCNVCRTCVTTNLVGLVFGAVAAGGLAVARLARRAVRR
jgi:hypothetical protein